MNDDARTFLQILIDVPEPIAEVASMLAEEAGARGIELRDSGTLPPPGEGKVPGGRAHILVWLDGESDREALQGELLARLGDAWRRGGFEGESKTAISFSTVDAEDWVRKVRESIRPVRVGRRLRIRPSWTPAEKNDVGELMEIVLDPGLAFGTGHHPTTSLCLTAIEELLDDARGKTSMPTILDVGTGSGILAIAAALLGSPRCLGIDNDPMAVKVGRENAMDNGVADRVEIDIDPPGVIDDLFDIVVANIHLGPLTEMAADVAARVAPGGRLLLSGLLEDQSEAAEAAYAAQGMMPVGRKLLDGWALVSMTR